jgi:hypothetical protein
MQRTAAGCVIISGFLFWPQNGELRARRGRVTGNSGRALMKTMKRSQCFFPTILVLTGAVACPAQDDSTCVSLSPDENVNAVAAALRICPAAKRIKDSQTSGAAARINPNAAPGAEQLRALTADTADQQRIMAAVTHAQRNATLLVLQLENAVLATQEQQWLAEKYAYRRTKIINSFLGTGVSAVGTGMQLSSRLSIQRDGDIISVVGGAITATFNICTADISEVDMEPNLPERLQQVLRSLAAGQQGNLPDDVWRYLQRDNQFMTEMKEAAEQPPPKPPKTFLGLSCHAKGAPKGSDRHNKPNTMNLLSQHIIKMNEGAEKLLEQFVPDR